ncbi:MAG: ATP-binding protein, partial [Verrucomicrobiales bacterium]|nr:ATP-binding protein [Verrucomicrobiales bacterium]
LEMAISNLLQNATDFAPPNSTVTVSLTADSSTTTLTITDAGPGIPDYALDRVFDRFYSLQHPDTGKKSSGLGLCFVKEAAHLHAGTATLTNNNPPPGATATLSLPTT